MHKKILIFVGILTIALIVVANVFSKRADVVIFTTIEDYRMNQLAVDLKNTFPNMNVALQYMSTGELVSKLSNDGTNTNCDIILGLEATNSEILLSKNPDILHNFVNDFSGEQSVENKYDENILSSIPETSYKKGEVVKYHIMDKEAGCIIINEEYLERKSQAEGKEIPIPTSFEDLKNTIYKNTICMPDPVYSGTGYYWFNGLVSSWGEDEAVSYFKEIDKNFVANGYTTSGSGPLKMLIKGEAGIAFGMSFQVARTLFEDKKLPEEEQQLKKLKMVYFDITDEGGTTYNSASPYTLYTMGVISNKWEKPAVKSVYQYIYEEWNYRDKYMFVPETIYKSQNEQDFKNKVKTYFGDYQYPKSYMPMKNVFDAEWKTKLLESWEKWRKK